jgi:hypothetical protein
VMRRLRRWSSPRGGPCQDLVFRALMRATFDDGADRTPVSRRCWSPPMSSGSSRVGGRGSVDLRRADGPARALRRHPTRAVGPLPDDGAHIKRAALMMFSAPHLTRPHGATVAPAPTRPR